MDLTSSELTITTGAGGDFAQAWPRLPAACKTEVLRLGRYMREIDASRFARRAMAEIARRENRRGLSDETLKRWYYRYKKHGLAGLIDHRKCGGCGVAGCHHEREAALSAETIRFWHSKAIGNDKRGLAEAWKVIIRMLVAGEEIPGAGRWRDVYAQTNPFAPQPDRCPWSLHRPPPGWSKSNFLRHQIPAAVLDLGRKGSFAAWEHLPEVRLDLTTLRPFEWLVVDDHRLDFEVYVDVPGRGVQLVELWGLFVMDVATRMIVSFALKPRVQRVDGTAMAFEHRDMQHLIAHVLGTYGVPADYDQRWIVENAAAAVSTECENLLNFLTGGRVSIKRTGIQVGDFHLSGFPERWGNYRGKRWLESWFGPLDIILGGVKGQKGSDYWSKPGSFDARQAFGNRLIKLLDKCTPEVRARLDLPFEWAGQAHWLVSEAVELLNHRVDHDLDGFQEVRFFAYDAASQPMPLCPQLADLHGTAQHLQAFTQVPKQLQELWLNQGGRPRRWSPAEKMAVQMPRMSRLSEEALMDLMFDEVTTWKRDPLIWRGGDVLDIDVRRGRGREVLRFHGAIPGVEIGQRVIARLNTDRPECGIWVLDEKRRYLGWMRHHAAPTHDDVEGLQRELGAKVKALRQTTAHLHRLTHTAADYQRRIGQIEELTETVNTLAPAKAADTPPEIPALPESAGLIRAIKSSTRSTPRQSATDRYLRRKGQA